MYARVHFFSVGPLMTIMALYTIFEHCEVVPIIIHSYTCMFCYVHYFYRGAAGRLMRLEDTQTLLDDFGIPLQISPSSDSKEKPPATNVRQNLSLVYFRELVLLEGEMMCKRMYMYVWVLLYNYAQLIGSLHLQQVVCVCMCVHVQWESLKFVCYTYICTPAPELLLLLQAPPLARPRPTMKLNSGASLPPHISRRKMSAPGNFTNHMVSTAIKTEPAQGRR